MSTESPEATAELPRAGAPRRQDQSQRRRARVLDAAQACFGRDGYAGATVARIAREAGVSNGLLYQFFRNKEQLFGVVLKQVVRDWVRAMVPRCDSAETPAQALEGMFRRSVDFCRSTPLLPALLSRDPALQLQRIQMASAERIEPHRELVASILQAGVTSGEFRSDLDVHSAADLICQLQSDYSRRAYADDPRFPLTPALIEAAVHFIHDAVRAR
jgi:TetR/AcrR family fatty acid metabolism transcriptional regulator